MVPFSARDAFKLALLGFSHPVDWWGLPTRLEWALAPDRGVLGYRTGSLAACMAFGRLHGPWVQELKPSSPPDFLRVVCWLSRPAAKVLVGPWSDYPGASRACIIHAVTEQAPPSLGCVDSLSVRRSKIICFGYRRCTGTLQQLHFRTVPN